MPSPAPEDRPISGPEASPGPILNVLGVTKRFGAVEALVECPLEVHAGEIVALVGDNALRAIGANAPSLRTPLGRLSGGQRQGVAIARTMLGAPRLVVLDEPTASLGVVQTAEVLTRLDRLRGLGPGVLVIGHNLNDLRAVADRIEVLPHGRNNGSFDGPTSRYDEIIGAITGAWRQER